MLELGYCAYTCLAPLKGLGRKGGSITKKHVLYISIKSYTVSESLEVMVKVTPYIAATPTQPSPDPILFGPHDNHDMLRCKIPHFRAKKSPQIPLPPHLLGQKFPNT